MTDPAPLRAADMVVKAPFAAKPAFHDRAFFSIEGGYFFNSSASNLAFAPGDFEVQLLSPMEPGRNGGTVAAAFGRTVGPHWDWAVAYRYASLGTNSVSSSTVIVNGAPFGTSNLTNFASNRLWYQHFDIEFGYHPPQWQTSNVRVFVGPRVLNARNKIDYAYDDFTFGTIGGDFSKLGNFHHDVDLWGAGPRAGLQASVPLFQSPVLLNVSGSGSAIFSRVNHHSAFSFRKEVLGPTISGSGDTTARSSRAVYNLEGSAALGYKASNTTLLQVGYQAQQWWNLATAITTADSEGRFQTGKSDVLTHGPFAKITVELP
jgi:hypothetical protein